MRIQDLTTSTRTKLTSNDLIVFDEYQSAGVYTTKKVTADKLDSRPYKVLSCLVTQSGTSAPTFTILENTFNGTPTMEYLSTGYYSVTLTGEITSNKLVGQIVPVAPSRLVNRYGVSYLDANRVQLSSGTPSSLSGQTSANSLLSADWLEFRVYN